MKKTTILVTAVSGDIGCSAVRSLNETGNKIIGCDMNPYTPVSQFLHKFYRAPAASDESRYMTFLNDIIIKEKVDFIVPISEPEIKILNIKKEEFLATGVKVLINNSSIVDNFLDKLKTVQYLSSIGIKTPKTSLLKEYDGSFAFPLIIKPRTGYGSKKIWKVQDSKDLDYVRSKDDGGLIIQEYVGSDSEEYTTGVFSDGQKVSSITFRRKLGFGGLSMEAVLVDEPFIEQLSLTVANAVGLIGSINIQSRRIMNKPVFVPFEINPRLSSTLLFRKKFGFDDLVWWINVLSGNSYRYEKKFKSGKAVRYVSECYFDMIDVEK